MDDPTKTVMDELARTSGVVGVERLAALFMRREPAAAKTMSIAEVKKMANDVLKIKPDKQILAYPKERSGGAIHASAPNEVWMVDTADMRGFNQKGAIHTYAGRGGCIYAQDSRRAHAGSLGGRSSVCVQVVGGRRPAKGLRH